MLGFVPVRDPLTACSRRHIVEWRSKRISCSGWNKDIFTIVLGQCLPGDRHKELATPEPEGPDYQECLQWHNETCCTAEFTQILAQANGSNIDGFHWNRCGDLSPRCRDYFVQIECFYR